MQTLNFGPYEDTNSLMHKLGIKSYTFKSGKLKDILNPARTPTDEEAKLVNDLIMEVYDKFVGIVADDLGRDRTFRQAADLLEDLLVRAAHLRVERWVGGHAVDDAPLDPGLDLLDVGGVQEELHRAPCFLALGPDLGGYAFDPLFRCAALVAAASTAPR